MHCSTGCKIHGCKVAEVGESSAGAQIDPGLAIMVLVTHGRQVEIERKSEFPPSVKISYSRHKDRKGS